MKKFFLIAMFLLSVNSVFAYEYTAPFINEIKESQSLIYNTETSEWKRVSPNFDKSVLCDKEIVFTKYWSKGSGGYSEYENSITDEDFFVLSTYEFLDGSQLIGYNAHLLKFFKINFVNEKFVLAELSHDEVQKYFPDVKLVKISDFKHNAITLKKNWFKPQVYMLLNDTKTDFYKYQFENVKTFQLVKGVFEIDKKMIKAQTILFTHFGIQEKLFPILKIEIVNSN